MIRKDACVVGTTRLRAFSFSSACLRSVISCPALEQPGMAPFASSTGVITAMIQNLAPSLPPRHPFPSALLSWVETGRWQYALAKNNPVFLAALLIVSESLLRRPALPFVGAVALQPLKLRKGNGL